MLCTQNTYDRDVHIPCYEAQGVAIGQVGDRVGRRRSQNALERLEPGDYRLGAAAARGDQGGERADGHRRRRPAPRAGPPPRRGAGP